MPMKPEPWEYQAACLDAEDDVFFSPDYESDEGNRNRQEMGLLKAETNDRELVAKARYCGGCPVRLACAQAGWNMEYGVFGGWAPYERRQLDAGTYRPTVVRAKISSSRDEVIRLVRDERLSLQDTATKLGVKQQAVNDQIRQFWTVVTSGHSE